MFPVFNLNSTALLVIDFQADNLNGGAIHIVGSAEVQPKAKQVLAAARAVGFPIIHTKEVHRKEMVDFGRELDGAEPVHPLNFCATITSQDCCSIGIPGGR
jgi:biuret amidohydrolase